jgi:hypothetical protein
MPVDERPSSRSGPVGGDLVARNPNQAPGMGKVNAGYAWGLAPHG